MHKCIIFSFKISSPIMLSAFAEFSLLKRYICRIRWISSPVTCTEHQKKMNAVHWLKSTNPAFSGCTSVFVNFVKKIHKFYLRIIDPTTARMDPACLRWRFANQSDFSDWNRELNDGVTFAHRRASFRIEVCFDAFGSLGLVAVIPFSHMDRPKFQQDLAILTACIFVQSIIRIFTMPFNCEEKGTSYLENLLWNTLEKQYKL